MKAFITGGSGFVGRNLIAALTDRGDAVRALAQSPQARKVVRDLGAEPVTGDLDDRAALQKGMTGCDTVFHSGAKVEDWGDAAEFDRINVGGTVNVLEAAKAAGVTKLVHVSTEAVLVDGTPIHNADETRPRPAQSMGLYPDSKRRAEEVVLAANRPGFQTVIVRPRLIWGEGDTTLLPQFADAVRQGKWMWMGGGNYLTSTCHVKNVVAGMLLAAEKGRGGEIYFLTDGEPVPFRDFITAMLHTQNVFPGDTSVPLPVARVFAAVAEQTWKSLHLKGNPPLTRTAVRLIGEEVTVSDKKARSELGYENVISRAQGLEEMAAAFKKRN